MTFHRLIRPLAISSVSLSPFNPCSESFLRCQFSSSASNPIKNSPVFSPIPHRDIVAARGHDHDFVTAAHTHLLLSDWARLKDLADSLTPFRFKHILLKTLGDPVLSLEFHRWTLLHAPSSQTLETQSILLHSLAKARRFIAADSLLRQTLIPRTRNSSWELFDAVLHSYRICESSPAVFDSMFKAYAHVKKFRDATETFRRMRVYGFLPSVRSCNAFISSLLGLSRADVVLSFYREMRRSRVTPNVYTVNMVMHAFCSSGKLEKAKEAFQKMEVMGIIPTVASYNTLIAGYCELGALSSAMKLKNEMFLKGLGPNVITYNTLVYGFCKEGMMHEANRIVREMTAKEVIPNTVTYNTLIAGYGRMNSSEMAFRIFEETVKSGLETNILTYNALILALCNEGKLKKAAYLVKELDTKNLVPNASTFFALISGQCKRDNSERAFALYKTMKERGCQPNSSLFSLLISTFCRNKDFEGVVEVFKEMQERWITPDKASLAEFFEGVSKHGKSHLASKLLPGTSLASSRPCCQSQRNPPPP